VIAMRAVTTLAMLLILGRGASPQDPPRLESIDSREWAMYGRSLQGANRHREAIAAFERAMQLRSEDAGQCAFAIAQSYARLGNTRQSLRWLEMKSLIESGRRPSIIRRPSSNMNHATPHLAFPRYARMDVRNRPATE
jgi:hypothetical protein